MVVAVTLRRVDALQLVDSIPFVMAPRVWVVLLNKIRVRGIILVAVVEDTGVELRVRMALEVQAAAILSCSQMQAVRRHLMTLPLRVLESAGKEKLGACSS